MTLALAGLLLLPLSSAHVEPRPNIIQRVDGDGVFTLELLADVVEAGRVAARLDHFAFSTGEHVPTARVSATLFAPDGQSAPVDLQATASGHWNATFDLSERGDWQVEMRDDSTGETALLPFHVYPESPYRFHWSERAQAGYFATEMSRIVVTVADADGAPLPLPSDAYVRIERWSNDWSTLLGLDAAPLGVDGAELVGRVVFAEPAQYALLVAAPSLGLGPGDRPPLVLYAHEPAPAPPLPTELRQSPAPAFLALAALVLVALARRAPGS